MFTSKSLVLLSIELLILFLFLDIADFGIWDLLFLICFIIWIDDFEEFDKTPFFLNNALRLIFFILTLKIGSTYYIYTS